MLEAFDVVGISPSEFIIELLNDHRYINHETVINLRESGQHLAELLMVQSDVVKGLYVREVQTLSAKESGYHFSVLNTSVEQLEEFDIDVLGKGMEVHAPMLWNLLDRLLSARGKGQKRDSGDPQVGKDDVSEDEEALWEELGDFLDLEEIVDGFEGNMSKKKNRIIAQRNELTTIKKGRYSEYIDAKLEPKFKRAAEHRWHIPAVSPHTPKGHRHTIENGC